MTYRRTTPAVSAVSPSSEPSTSSIPPQDNTVPTPADAPTAHRPVSTPLACPQQAYTEPQRVRPTRPNVRHDQHSARPRPDAAQVVADVARRLADPCAVEGIAVAAENTDTYTDGPARPPWEPLSLIEGFCGVALLPAELGRTEAAARSTAHAYLVAAGAPSWSPRSPTGLYEGPAALAFAARAAAHKPGDYATLRGRLDQAVLTHVEVLAAAPAAPSRYEVLGGLAGLGRHLLADGPQHRDALGTVLRSLVRLAEPVPAHGTELSGWWRGGDGPVSRVSLGMAHGIAGPLALLALADRHGSRVPGAQGAVDRMVQWLLSWRQYDEAGPFWPVEVSLREQLAGGLEQQPRARAGWCHGSAGIARALQLAGLAHGRPDWSQAGLDALDAVLARTLGPVPMANTGLCHGWAGLLRITQLIARDAATDAFDDRLDAVAEAVRGGFRPDSPFGFALVSPGEVHLARDRAGFLEGAAGIALALHAHLRRADPVTGWDMALLID
ncbi:lanthionine synthetase C family protein [Streptomyces sp. NPDC002755]|uniref:lanthionine synthetase C family protein n=1 Tax=Streptomyces sp. NPDC002884 TaxID=3154544 RepID=UPI0033318561